jgi:hypothetical protein
MSQEKLTINISLGAMAPSLKSQLKVFSFIPADEIKFLQKLSDSISILAFHNLISDSQRIKAYEKLIKKIHKTIVKFSKVHDSVS